MALLDSISAVPLAAYSLRKLRAAYSGAAIQVYRTTSSSLHDVGFTATGDFDLASFDALGPRSILQIQKFYDQKASLDLDFASLRPFLDVMQRPMINWGRVANNNIIGTSSGTVNLTAPKQFVVMDYAVQNGCTIVDFGTNQFRLWVSASLNQTNGSTVSYGFSTTGDAPSELRGAMQVSSYFQTGTDGLRVNGVDMTGAANAGDTARSGVNICLGNSQVTGFGLTGRIGEFILFDGTVSTGDRDIIEASQISYFENGKRLVAFGDSLEYGYPLDNSAPFLAETFNPIAQARDVLGDGWDTYNRAWSGKTLLQMISQAAAMVDVLYRPTATQNILCVNGGFNDAFAGASAATIISRWQTFLTARRAVGWKLIIAPMPLSTVGGQPADYATTRATVNNWIAANPSYYDGFSDFRTDHFIGDNGDTTNTVYFTDLIHHTQAGYARWAGYTASAVLSSIASSTPTIKDHLASNVTFICQIWKITAADGRVAAYAAHTRDLTFNSVLYKAAPVEPSRFTETLGVGEANNVELFGVFDDVITEEDIQGGRWKNARIRSEWVNYLDLTMGSVKVMKGQAGKFTIDNGTFRVEQQSLAGLLHQEIGDLTSPLDRNRLPEDLGISIGSFTFSRSITAVADRRNFTVGGSAQPNSYFKYGRAIFKTRGITWTDLVNATVIADNEIQKSGGTNAVYDGGAASIQSISAGQYAQCSANTTLNHFKAFGLSAVNTGVLLNTIEFAVQLTDTAGTKTAQAYELGVAKGSSFTFLNTDFIRIRYGTDNVIRYYLVDSGGVETLKYTSLVTPSPRLIVDVGLATTATSISKVKIGMDSGIQQMEIKDNTGNAIELQLATSWGQANFDDVDLIAGYDGTRDQARDKFAAMEAFQGEPDLPGLKGIIEYPE